MTISNNLPRRPACTSPRTDLCVATARVNSANPAGECLITRVTPAKSSISTTRAKNAGTANSRCAKIRTAGRRCKTPAKKYCNVATSASGSKRKRNARLAWSVPTFPLKTYLIVDKGRILQYLLVGEFGLGAHRQKSMRPHLPLPLCSKKPRYKMVLAQNYFWVLLVSKLQVLVQVSEIIVVDTARRCTSAT